MIEQSARGQRQCVLREAVNTGLTKYEGLFCFMRVMLLLLAALQDSVENKKKKSAVIGVSKDATIPHKEPL